MSQNESPGDETLSFSALGRIEEICRGFEDAWKAGGRPEIESYLPRLPLPERPELLRQLLLLELAYRRKRGEQPALEEYCRRFPGYEQVVDAAFKRAFVASQTPSQSEPAPLAPGQRIGRYRVERELGRGSFGIVYLAEDEELHRRVAIKVLRPKWRGVAAVDERFVEEARTVANLKHPLIVPVYDAGRCEDGTPFVVMEYIDGQSLKDLLKAGRVSPERAAELIAQVAEAAGYAHRQGFVHRDLKPANILLDAAGNPRIADFGLALHESVQRQRAREHAGTLPYMAPEQVRGEAHRLDGRTDIWALGVMLYEMLAGCRPFGGADQSEIEDEIEHREPKPPRQIDQSVPEELERICLKCLAKDVRDRYATAGDLARDLRRWQRPKRPWWVPLGVAAASVVLVILAVVFLATRRGEPPLPPLSARIDIHVSNKSDKARDLQEVRTPGVLPLRAGDAVRFDAALNRPAYLYLVLIDPQGAATPIYPWEPGNWERRRPEKPVTRAGTPEDPTDFWPLTGTAGVETVLLLARETPLSAGEEAGLRNALAGLSPQTSGQARPMLAFNNGMVIEHPMGEETFGGLRSFDVDAPRSRDDAVLRNLGALDQRLREGGYFDLLYAITVEHREPDAR